MIKVAVAGYSGRMGSAVVDAVSAADDMEVVCGIDPYATEQAFPTFATIDEALAGAQFDVLVDFTQPDVVAKTLAVALPAGIDCVVGTTGMSQDTLQELASSAADGACLFYAPNFTTGAVLMMEFAKIAAPYFPEAEIIEFHHANKKDAPSGTAVRTAEIIQESRGRDSVAPGKETENAGCEGARGAEVAGVPVHSVRSMGYVASQEVVFGLDGPDAHDPSRFMGSHLLYARCLARHSQCWRTAWSYCRFQAHVRVARCSCHNMSSNRVATVPLVSICACLGS